MQKPVWILVLVIVLAAAGLGLYSQGRIAREIPMPQAVAFRILLSAGKGSENAQVPRPSLGCQPQDLLALR